jgi:thioredoxin 2
VNDSHLLRCPSCGKLNRVSPERRDPRCGSCHAEIDSANPPFYASDDDLDALVGKSPLPVLVDFYADWCGPCRTLAPVLTELARKHTGRLLVAKIDTERHQRVAARLGVTGIPALFLYKDGVVVAETTGARPLPALESWIAPHL